MTQALYRTWRPALWEEVVGQDHIVRTLQNAICNGRVGHAYLFAGPKGTGKTSCARLLSKAVNCLDPDPAMRPCNHCANCVAVNEGRMLDLIEIDAASNTGVDDIRDLRDKINFAPSQGRYKVYLIDEVHMLSSSAFNALLKTLEEPPAHVIFILATTEIHKIPATVLSRCQRHEFRRIPIVAILEKLIVLCENEKIQIQPEALNLVARHAGGSLRDAISLLDQLSSMGGEVTLELVQEVLGVATNMAVLGLVDAILALDHAKGLEMMHQALDGGADVRQFARQTVDYLRELLIIKMRVDYVPDVSSDIRDRMQEQAGKFETSQIIHCVNCFSDAASGVKTNWNPSLGLEMAYAQALLWKPALAVSSAPAIKAEEKGRSVLSSVVNRTAEPAPANKATANRKAPSNEPAKPAQKPASSTPLAPAPSEKTVEPVEINLEVLMARWDDIKNVTGNKNRVTKAILNYGRLLSYRDGVITLAFSAELFVNRLAEEDHQKTLRAVFLQLFHKDLRMVGVFLSKDEMPSEDEAGNLVDRVVNELGGVVRTTNDKES